MSGLLAVQAVSKRFGGLTALDDVTFAAGEGRITGLIGPNGAGKTTLFALISGFERPTAGRILFRGADVTTTPAHLRASAGIARTFQIVQPFGRLTVLDNIAIGAHLRRRARAEALAAAAAIADLVGLSALADRPAGSLTLAARKRLELARALATEPALLLLDEVLAGLNPSEIAGVVPVIRKIRDTGVTVIMVEHVMQAVMDLCEYLLVLSQGRLIAQGPPGEVTRDRAVIEAYLGEGAAARLQAQHV
jgi:branched-chain amino acid transport system ATP-binding protein